MTTTPQESPQLSTPEGQEGLVAPGQEELAQQIQQESQVSEDAQKVLEKFNGDNAALAKSYAELQRKFTQNQQQKPETETKTETQPDQVADSYTIEQASSVYGEENVKALAEKGLNLPKIMFDADSGKDISEHYGALAEQFKVPPELVSAVVQKWTTDAPEAEEPGVTEEQEAEIKGEVGGEEAWNQMAAWANKNLKEDEVNSLQETMDSGNMDAIRWAVRSMQLQMANPNAVVEGKLIGGGDVPTETVFKSNQQVLDAMNKRNDRGQKLYEVDEAYQEQVKQILARSPDVF